MTDYQKYINALRKCAKEHENDRTLTGHIVVSDLCRDTANLLEALEQESYEDAISRNKVLEGKVVHQSCEGVEIINSYAVPVEYIEQLPIIQPQPKTVH